MSACTGLESYGTGCLAVQTTSIADYKIININLCTKTRHGGGEHSSASGVSSLSPRSPFKGGDLITVVLFCFRRTEKLG